MFDDAIMLKKINCLVKFLFYWPPGLLHIPWVQEAKFNNRIEYFMKNTYN